MQRAIASFGCKTNSSTLKNTTQNAPNPTILRAKIKKFSPTPLHLGIFAPAALELSAVGASFSSPLNFFYLAPPVVPFWVRCDFSRLKTVNIELLCWVYSYYIRAWHMKSAMN